MAVELVGQVGPLVIQTVIRDVTKTRGQRERHQRKGLMSKTMAVHVRYNSWYISLPFSAKQTGGFSNDGGDDGDDVL